MATNIINNAHKTALQGSRLVLWTLLVAIAGHKGVRVRPPQHVVAMHQLPFSTQNGSNKDSAKQIYAHVGSKTQSSEANLPSIRDQKMTATSTDGPGTSNSISHLKQDACDRIHDQLDK